MARVEREIIRDVLKAAADPSVSDEQLQGRIRAHCIGLRGNTDLLLTPATRLLPPLEIKEGEGEAGKAEEDEFRRELLRGILQAQADRALFCFAVKKVQPQGC